MKYKGCIACEYGFHFILNSLIDLILKVDINMLKSNIFILFLLMFLSYLNVHCKKKKKNKDLFIILLFYCLSL